MLGHYLKTGHTCFLPHPLQFISHSHLTIRCYITTTVEKALHNPRIKHL